MAVVRRAAIKEPAIKQKFVLFYFYFGFIAVVRAALTKALTCQGINCSLRNINATKNSNTVTKKL